MAMGFALRFVSRTRRKTTLLVEVRRERPQGRLPIASVSPIVVGRLGGPFAVDQAAVNAKAVHGHLVGDEAEDEGRAVDPPRRATTRSR